MRKSLGVAIGLCVCMATVALGLNGPAGAAKASGPPIQIGILPNDTGIIAVPEELQAVEAYVKAWNARGGWHGRQILLAKEPGPGIDPVATGNEARALVDNSANVALVGNFAQFDCSINGALYKSSDIPVFGYPIDESCYSLPRYFPATPNVVGNIVAAAKFLMNGGIKNLAIAQLPIALTSTWFKAATAYVESRGGTLVTFEYPGLLPTAGDMDSFLAQAKAAGAKGLIIGGRGCDQPIAGINTASQDGMGAAQGYKFVLTISCYAPTIAQEIQTDIGAADRSDVFVTSVTDPFDKPSKAGAAAIKVLSKDHVTLDTFSAGGWDSVALFELALNKVHGNPTRASVTKAARSLKNVELPFLSQPFNYSKTPIAAGLPSGGAFSKVVNGKFVAVAPWQTVSKEFSPIP